MLVPFGSLLLIASAATAQTATNDTVRLKDVVVQGAAEVEPSYSAADATTALKSDVPVLETPQAVSVVTRTLMNDQNARKLDDVLKNVSGVTVGGYYSDWDYYRIRGFDASFTASIDGLLGNNGDAEETFGLERVDVLKGPASSLYGQGSLGGMVNLVTKHPQRENFFKPQFTIGSYDFYEPAFDWNVTLNKSQTVYMRLNALYRDQGSFVDYAGSRRVFVAPSLTWEISDQTKLTVLTSFRESWVDHSFPLPAAGTVLPSPYGEIPISRFLGEPGRSDKADISTGYVGYELTHQFNETFSLYQNARSYWDQQHWDGMLYPWFMEDDGRTLNRWRYEYKSRRDAQRVDTGLHARFETAKLENQLTLGVDYLRDAWHDRDRSSTEFSQIDVFDPVYGGPLPDYGEWGSNVSDSWQTGLYLQDFVKAFDRVTVLLGGRMSWSESGEDSADAFTPRVGIAYEFVKGFSAYANYSRSFNPQWYYRDAANNVVDPELGENFEAGLKTATTDSKLTGSLAVYQLTRQNVATPGDSAFSYYNTIGEQRSRGVELEGGYRPLAGLELTAAYTYINGEVAQSSTNSVPVGTRLQGVPEHAINTWVKYTLQDGPLKGFGVGLGGRYYTDQSGDEYHTFDLPAYGLMDTAVYYDRGKFHAQININNVLDERYFIGSYDSLYVLPGDPLTVRATVGWTF